MADIGNTSNEDDSGDGRGGHNNPKCPGKATAGIGNSEQCNGDAALDEGGGGSVEELGDEEELCGSQLYFVLLLIVEGESTNLDSLHVFIGGDIGRKLARPEVGADNT